MGRRRCCSFGPTRFALPRHAKGKETPALKPSAQSCNLDMGLVYLSLDLNAARWQMPNRNLHHDSGACGMIYANKARTHFAI